MQLNKEKIYDTIIIGGGCAGLAAAMYCGRFEMKTLLLGEIIGGTIITTDIVENYPGFIRLTGIELAEKLKEHAKSYPSVEMKEEKVEDVVYGKDTDSFHLITARNNYRSKTIIFATGTEIKKLNVPGEREFANRGVHYCALCDGAFFKDKIIGVVGGSDSSAKEALLLTQFGRKVYIIYRGENIRPEPINYKRVMENKKIEIIYRTNVVEIKGNKVVTHVVLDNPYKGSTELRLDAMFVEIGHIPLTNMANKLGVNLNNRGEIIINRESKTNLRGVFAAGDCVDTKFKQAITGVGEAVSASYSAYQYLKENGHIIT